MQLMPIRMFPVYRSGLETPWGGNRLGVDFGKPIPNERTGECLEVSGLPGLGSIDEHGKTLNELIQQYGRRLTGTRIGTEFPLLLKLIDARDKLSVQVHPDDELARVLENKSGKSEAWLVLRADPGATILYGVKENTTLDMLRVAMSGDGEIENLLQSIPVRAGDMIDIPAGTVHAIGAGITLYEIQQSSDVTYRLYDWQRVDETGKKRALHIEKALMATNVSIKHTPAKPIVISQSETGLRTQLLKNKHFTLERWTGCHNEPLQPDLERFKILTALTGLTLRNENSKAEIMRARRIESIILPADGIPLSVACDDMLVAYPTL